MHDSVMKWGADRLARIGSVESCLEIGSYDVNGSLRPFVDAERYVGIDVVDGPGVDKIMDGLDAPMLGRFDLVIMTEVLEHAEHWTALVLAAKACMSPYGNILVSARGPGYPFHGTVYDEAHTWAIGDWWRFTPMDLSAAFGDLNVMDCRSDPDPTRPGVVLHGMKVFRLASTMEAWYPHPERAPLP